MTPVSTRENPTAVAMIAKGAVRRGRLRLGTMANATADAVWPDGKLDESLAGARRAVGTNSRGGRSRGTQRFTP